jgi:DnaJ-class molecular chaperone
VSACPICQGNGTQPCQTCLNTAHVACEQCGGTGFSLIEEDDDDADQEPCDICHGECQVPCPTCSGSGQITCSHCQGTGAV